MSYTADSLETVNEVLTPLAPLNAQFPLLLYSRKNCTGQRYPAEGEFGLWNQDLKEEMVGFNDIVSLYVPPHAVLELWNTSDGEGYYAVPGPALISDTGAYLAFWRHYDDSPCFPHELHCGKRVGSNTGWRLGVDVARLRVTWSSSWLRLLHNMAANQQGLTFGGTEYAVNNDTLFNELCPHPYNRYSCNCHSAYQQLMAQHPAAASSSYVNLLQNGCNPLTMYVPSQARVGAATTQECTTQIHAQLKTGTFPSLDQGGPQYYTCAGHTYVNAVAGMNTSRESSSSDQTKNAETLSEEGLPVYAWYVIGGMLILLMLLGLCYLWFSTRRARRTKSSRSTDIRRVRMQHLLPLK